jgi:transposase
VKPDPPVPPLGNIPPEVLAAVDPNCPGCQALLGFFGAQLAALTERMEQLEARVNQNSANSSRPPSSEPPAPPPTGQRGSPGRRLGGQPGHRGVHRALKPLEAVAEVVEEIPPHCAHCQAPLPAGQAEDDPPPRRHPVTELPPIVCVTTEYRLHARPCRHCRKRTWADLPAGVPRGGVGPRLQAVGSLLTGG